VILRAIEPEKRREARERLESTGEKVVTHIELLCAAAMGGAWVFIFSTIV
jgi:hypothetical protein